MVGCTAYFADTHYGVTKEARGGLWHRPLLFAIRQLKR